MLFAYFIFSFLMFFFCFLVFSSKYPMFSVFFLILLFVNSSVLMLILGCEVFALFYVILYVGAITVLFLFVVMTINLRILDYSLDSLVFFLFLFFLFFPILCFFIFYNYFNFADFIDWFCFFPPIEWEIYVMGSFLYVDYFPIFLVSGFLLFVAVLGPIILTLEVDDFYYKKQVLFEQLNRDVYTSILAVDRLM